MRKAAQVQTTLEIVDSHHPLTRKEIQVAQREIGVVLPDAYVQFLLCHNGGRFRWEALYPMLQKPSGGPGGICEFFGIRKSKRIRFGDVRYGTQREPDSGVPGLVPIAVDNVGLVLICCHGDKTGNVYLRLFDSDEGEHMHLIARSFQDFVASCYVPSDQLTMPPGAFGLVEKGDSPGLKAELSKGLSVETRDEQGETLLSFACKCYTPRCTRILLECGASPSVKNGLGQFPLEVAIESWALDCVRLLIEFHADIETHCANGDSPLLKSAKQGSGSARITELLIESGANIAATDATGATALCYAAGLPQNDDHVASALLSKGADVEASTSWLERYADGTVHWPFAALARLGAKRELIRLATDGQKIAMEHLLSFDLGDRKIQAAFREAAGHSNSEVRAYAAECIGSTHCPTRQNLKILRMLSLDVDVAVQECAKMAMEQIRQSQPGCDGMMEK